MAKQVISKGFLTLALGLAACTGYGLHDLPSARADTLSGSYSTPFEGYNIVQAHLNPDGSCPQGSHDMGNGFCVENYNTQNTLDIKEQPNGDLQFSTMTNGANGSNCGADGIAKKIKKDQWRWKSNDDGGQCVVYFNADAKGISFTQAYQPKYPEDADCSYYCGARATLGGDFPFSSKQATPKAAP